MIAKLRKENVKKMQCHCISQDDVCTASNKRRLVIFKNSDSPATIHHPCHFYDDASLFDSERVTQRFTFTCWGGSYMTHGKASAETLIDQRRSSKRDHTRSWSNYKAVSVIWPRSYGQFYRTGSRFNDNSKWHRYSETTADDAPAVAIDR